MTKKIDNAHTKSNGRYCDFKLYSKLNSELEKTGKRPKRMVEIVKQLESETDFYQMNEYEMSLLTGTKLDALRNNRRSSISNKRWNFRKGGSYNSKVTYPLQWVRAELEAPTH